MLMLMLGCNGAIDHRSTGVGQGGECASTEACATGLACSHAGTCEEEGLPGTYSVGEECVHEEECALDLSCDSEGVCAEPGSPGTGGEGDSCLSDDDCQLGWYCDEDTCADLEVPYWPGADCADDGDFRFYFEVPALPAHASTEFFRLPWPNDARLDNDAVDLSAFPSPGGAVDDWLAAAEEVEGYSLFSTVYFRASRQLDTTSIRGLTGQGDTLYMAVLDEDAEDYGQRNSFSWKVSTGRTRSICPNWVAVGIYPGVPLSPNTTYAVWLTTGVKDASGASPSQDGDLKVLLGDTRPGSDGDNRLVPGWDAYDPLRDFFQAEGVEPSSIATAAVFTTGDPARASRNILNSLQNEAPPTTLLDLTECEGSSGPCGQCAGDLQGFGTLEATFTLPIYGDDSDDWAWDAITHNPFVRSLQKRCVVFSVPDGEPPEGGWPLALIVKDEGEELRQHLTDGLAQELSSRGLATVAVEAPAGLLDLQDPNGSVGRRLQLVADQHALARVLSELEEEQLPLDTDDLHLVARGAGADASWSFLANHAVVHSAVLSSTGGWELRRLLDSVDGQTGEPGLYALRRLLNDTKVDRFHPMANVLQLVLERSDPAVFARELWKDPRPGSRSRHVLHLYAVDDLIVGGAAQQALQLASRIPTVGGVLVDFDQATGALPASRNALNDQGDRRTVGSVQVSAGRDAMIQNLSLDRLGAFVESALYGADPTIE